jgi:hypothetical protein
MKPMINPCFTRNNRFGCGTLFSMKRHTQHRALVRLVASFAAACLLLSIADAMDEEPVFWSFQPVQRVTVPVVAFPIQSPVDSFIIQRLVDRGMFPSPAADRRTLLRRATFDLVGLPPTPAELDAFLADESPEAFAKVVDRLLESPRYGERWGRHWLDIVRYADARDLIQLPPESDFREAWRYRDWVINSFNQDLPYDQFVRKQVAGDLLQPADPNQIDADALVATGMLAIADFVPGDVDKQQMIADYVNDQIDVVGRAILGLTLACARCHDHKFDPISTEDYYAMAGIFFSSRLIPGPVKGNTPLVRVPLLAPPQIAAIEAGQARDQARIGELSREVSQFGEREYQALLEQRVEAETERYLLACFEFAHRSSPKGPADWSEFASTKQLDLTTLQRWHRLLEGASTETVLAEIRTAADPGTAARLTQELAAKIVRVAQDRRDRFTQDAVFKILSESACLTLRGDDRRLTVNEARHVTSWPNRSRRPEAATPVTDLTGPAVATVMIQGRARTVLQFRGQNQLRATGTIPPAGTLMVLFRSDPAGPSGQRLVGWEDAAVGQHGLGMMVDGTGSIHAILRRQGASGDVMIPAPSPRPESSGFQLITIVWGPQGVSVYRDGQPVGSNKGIDSVSSDPAITALMIGGAGSGSSPRFQGELAELRVFDAPLADEARARVEAELTQYWFASQVDATIVDATQIESPSVETVSSFYEELISGSSPFRLEGEARDRALPADFRERSAGLREELEQLRKKPAVEIPRGVVIQEGGPPETPHAGFQDAPVYLRGNHTRPGKIVPRGVPKVIAGARPPVIQAGSGRRELAQWLADAENPLTARVMVNRVWQHHFGAGLVQTSANFGAMGDRPTHPELLDFLADRFVASGWSVKSLHRLLMLSNTYQQSSATHAAGMELDPENHGLWRSNRRRLEVEAFRDSLFAIAGRLDLTSGGPGFQDVAHPRRSVYLMATRTGAKAAEFGPLFDAPDCSAIVERRNGSIVAPQALFLLNDPLVTELSAALGDRVTREVGATENDLPRIRRLYEIGLGRLPTVTEVEIGLSLLSDPNQPNAWAGYCRLVLCTNEFMFVD